MIERDIFLKVIDIADPAARANFLDQACGQDQVLRDKVLALLKSHDDAGSFLVEPPAELASDDELGKHSQTVAEGDSANAIEQQTIGSLVDNRFELQAVIGEGGMGTVFRARQFAPVERDVALKLIKTGMDSSSVLARFNAERQALAVMDHPSIARVFDGGTTSSGQPYFVMELVRGIPITEYCDEHRLNVNARLELFVTVCRAVQHAHQKGVIHRDLKPGNVLVTEVDGRPTPKVIDFGVAKAVNQSLATRSFIDFGAIVGTPAYMSPEQADPATEDIDTRTDVYALGVILYELLAGSPPIPPKEFERGALIEMLRMVREVEPPKPSTRVSTAEGLPGIAANRDIDPAKLSKLLRGDLDLVVLKALEKDRSRRYETANGFAADIERHLANEPVTARSPSAAYRLQKFIQRNKLVFAGAVMVAASLVAGMTIAFWQAVRANREAERTQIALEELRATAPAFVEQARSLASEERFADAIEKLDYAAKLKADDAEIAVAKADLLRCQLRLSEAAAEYRKALAIDAGHPRAKSGAALCEEILAAPAGSDGRLSRTSLSKLHVAMQNEQRPSAELMPVARLLGEERSVLVRYWLERLKDLPISSDRPLDQRLALQDDGLLSLDLSHTRIDDLTPLAGMPLGTLDLTGCKELEDFSALREIRSLKQLILKGTGIVDLAPLSGLSLAELQLEDSHVSDLSPLRGLKLNRLSLRQTNVRDMSPLAGMPLRYLDATRIPATDYSPLAGAPLEVCYFQSVSIHTLSFLRGAPVRELSVHGCDKLRGLSILQDLKSLEFLILPGTFRSLPDEDYAAIAALRSHPTLKSIHAGSEDGTLLTIQTAQPKESFWRDWDREQSFVPALRMRTLSFRIDRIASGGYRLEILNQPFPDLSILRESPITELSLKNCGIRDLTLIENLPLRELILNANPVSNIQPLKGMPLEELSLDATGISDLSPLAGMPLRKLYLHDCMQLTDVSILKGISTLEQVTVPMHASNVEVLRTLPNLKRLGFRMTGHAPWMPATDVNEFWKLWATDWMRRLHRSKVKFAARQMPDSTWLVEIQSSDFNDVSILEGASISVLSLGGTSVSDLTPLRGMNLFVLFLYDTPVTDLAPLADMPLKHLVLNRTKVSDLSPLRRMPLVSLRLNDCREITDVAPLADIATLVVTTVPPNARNIEVLRGHSALQRISFREDPIPPNLPDKTVSQFWKEFDTNKNRSD